MTIYAYAANILDFDTGSDAQDDTTVNGGIESLSGAFSEPKFVEKTFTPVTANCWVHFSANFTTSSTGSSSSAPDLLIYDGAGTSVFEIFSSEPDTVPRFRVRNSAGTLLQEWLWSDVTSANPATFNAFDVFFDFSAGSLTLYVNGGEVLSYTGHGRTSISKVRFANEDDYSSIESFGEFLVASWATIGARVKNVAMGTPSTNNLTGTVSDLKDRTDNTTQSTYLSANMTGTTAGDSFIAPTTGYTKDATTTIAAVVHSVHSFASVGSAVNTLKNQFVIGGTEYDLATNSLTGSQAQYSVLQETNPATTSAWTESDVQGMSVGLQLDT